MPLFRVNIMVVASSVAALGLENPIFDLVSKPDLPSAALGVNYNHQHAEGGSGNSCAVFVCSRGMCIESMGVRAVM